MPLRLFGAVMALAIIAAVAVAVTLTGGSPIQAQSTTYADPQPCGPGPESLAPAFMEEPHERTTGHYALFDTYWEKTEPDLGETPGLGDELANTGILHTNTCPPYVSQTTETKGLNTVTVTAYSESDVDIDELIIHVTDLRKVAVVATDAEATAGQLSLAKYEGLREALGLGGGDAVPAGTEVWWLRTDDPSTPAVDESAVDDPNTNVDDTTAANSNGLSLGFSTRHLDGQYWAKQVDGENVPPLRYAFEVERNPGIDPAEHPHVLNYRPARTSSGSTPTIIWNSHAVHTQPLDMEPGQFESFEWIFTKAGTYEISVHLIGWRNGKAPQGAGADWKPISNKVTESSEVKTYTVQVGNLLENEPPVFGVSLTAPENSPAGTLVGAPIPIFEGEADTFYYSLSGEGHDQFALEAITDPHSVQIKVADGANLDYETKPSYELRLNVTDRIDHESNHDLSIDDTLAVRIALEDEGPSVTLSASDTNPMVGETVALTAHMREAPPSINPVLTWYQKEEGFDDDFGVLWDEGGMHHIHGTQYSVTRYSGIGTESLKVKLDWGPGSGSVWSNAVTIVWRAQ